MQGLMINTFGLTEADIDIIRNNVPSKCCEIIDTDCFTDLIAVSSFAIISRTEKMNASDFNLLWEYYAEVQYPTESVILIGNAEVPENVKSIIKVYTSFETLKNNIKYILLSAYRKHKKSENFSSTMANTLLILSQIRRFPGITTTKLAVNLEITPRSIQRYIETLRVAGEWIDYDFVKKGWFLSVNKSVLWGDFDNDMEEK